MESFLLKTQSINQAPESVSILKVFRFLLSGVKKTSQNHPQMVNVDLWVILGPVKQTITVFVHTDQWTHKDPQVFRVIY